MKKQLLYTDLAKYYDLIYSFKAYKKESEQVKRFIKKYKKSEGKELLDVACGTGKHLKYLQDKFNCTGVDINEGMLKIAKENFPNVTFQKSDMIKLNINKNFDIITCLFSSIGYVKTYKNLRKAIYGFSNHLNKGGVLIIEPWISKEDYNVGMPHMTTYDRKDIKIARVNVSKIIEDVSILEFNYLVAEKDKEVKYFVDKHELGLFGIEDTLDIMQEAGLKAIYLKSGLMEHRGVFIGIKET